MTDISTVTEHVPATEPNMPNRGSFESTPPQKMKRGRPPKGINSPRFDSRLQIKLTPEGRQKLDELVVRMGAAGVAAVVRDALRVYDIVTEDVVVNGNQHLSRDKETGEIEKYAFWN